MTDKEETDIKKYIPYILTVISLAISCYVLYQYTIRKSKNSKKQCIDAINPHNVDKYVNKLQYKEHNKNDNMFNYKPTVVVGPSGVGKGTLLKVLKNKYPNTFAVAVSHTTRKPRQCEIDGVHYNFVSKKQFENDITENKFIAYVTIYGNIYGTSRKSVQDVIKNKKICLLEVSYIGAKLIKESSIDANYLFITVNGEHEICRKRIEGRGTENKQQIEKRVQIAKNEFEFFKNNGDFFDAWISNDDLNKSSKQIIELFSKWYNHLKLTNKQTKQ